ncbi:MAG: hypothetical protein HPY73_05435 [Methanomassiliicoccales archaeon]|nr:MAG: hypothetical protein HPY73_05435 [Methanomassiliicoccales archaeon]
MRCRGSDRLRSTYPSKSRFIRKDKEGVASVVGTIMALLIFLTLLTLFVNTWMPVTLKEHERTHMDSVMNEFGYMKGSLDNMVIYTRLSGQPSLPVYQSIDLGSEGIPAFASPTAGLLTITPVGGSTSMSRLTVTVGGVSVSPSPGGGSIEFYAPNRYYVQQWIAYENGAIILKQDDGQIARSKPGIIFLLDSNSPSGPVLNTVFYQTSLIGKASSNSGTGSIGINLEVVTVMESNYRPDVDSNIVFDFTTKYGEAYYNYLVETLTGIAGMPLLGSEANRKVTINPDHYYYQNQAPGNLDPTKLFWKVELNKNPTTGIYTVSLTIKNVGISNVAYYHSFVNYEVTK